MSRYPHLPLDAFARGIIAEHPHAIVAWWLMAAYLYHQTDHVLLTDEYFDELGRDMLARWSEIQHPHKHLIDQAALQTGSGFHIPARAYPRITIAAAEQLVERGPSSRPDVVPLLEATDVAEPPAQRNANLPPNAQQPTPAPAQGELF